MKILIAHNTYQQQGGEDAVVKAELELLRTHGHDVRFLGISNDEFNTLSLPGKLSNIFSWPWSKPSYRRMQQACFSFKPDIVHVHNTFFMLSPSIYDACADLKIPVVQTVHNFRLLCANALFLREGRVCEDCTKGSLLPAIWHRCYRQSFFLSWAIVRMIKCSWATKVWQKKVGAFIVMNDFVRAKFLNRGIDDQKFWVKPNFLVKDPGCNVEQGEYFLYAGRLSREKGLDVLVDAFAHMTHLKLVILGNGPLKAILQEKIKSRGFSNIHLAGYQEGEAYFSYFKKAKAFILPSLCYENCPMSIVEAFACGVPVIASRLGSLQAMVTERQNGLLFNPGDSQDLCAAVQALEDDDFRRNLGQGARQAYLNAYTAQASYAKMMQVYKTLVAV